MFRRHRSRKPNSGSRANCSVARPRRPPPAHDAAMAEGCYATTAAVAPTRGHTQGSSPAAVMPPSRLRSSPCFAARSDERAAHPQLSRRTERRGTLRSRCRTRPPSRFRQDRPFIVKIPRLPASPRENGCSEAIVRFPVRSVLAPEDHCQVIHRVLFLRSRWTGRGFRRKSDVST